MSKSCDPANLTAGERTMLEEAAASGFAYVRGRTRIAARLDRARLVRFEWRRLDRTRLALALTDAGRSAIGLAPRGVS